MANIIEVTIILPDGQRYRAKINSEVDYETLLSGIIETLNLPAKDSTGNPIRYGLETIGATKLQPGGTIRITQPEPSIVYFEKEEGQRPQHVATTITWLHISDLHFRTNARSWDEDIVLLTLLKDVAERIEGDGLRPDFIAVTGDVAFSGQPAEYDLAQHFFDDLLKCVKLGKDRLFLVPGNHDVDRALISRGAQHVGDSLLDREAVNHVLVSPGDRELMFARFNGYAEFINSYLAEYSQFDAEHPHYTRWLDVAGQRIALLGLNSAWLASSDQDKAKGLLLGERQVRAALDTAANADLRIAMMHHPFDWLREVDRNDVEPLLLRECDFVLHGHLHDTFPRQFQLPGNEAAVIGAGALYETRTFPNTYNFVVLNLSAGYGIVHLRRYSDRQGGFWTKDVTTYRNVLDGEYRFDLPDSLRQSLQLIDPLEKEPGTNNYYYGNIRTLLTRGFSTDELRLLCDNRPEFRQLREQLPQNTSLAETVDRLISYARDRSELETLLTWAREENPRRYAAHQPYNEDDPQGASQEEPRNLAAIRELLRKSFTTQQLWRFFQDHPTFHPVEYVLNPNAALDEMITQLISYAERRMLLDELLEEVARSNPQQYNRFAVLHGYKPVPSPMRVPRPLPSTVIPTYSDLEIHLIRGTGNGLADRDYAMTIQTQTGAFASGIMSLPWSQEEQSSLLAGLEHGLRDSHALLRTGQQLFRSLLNVDNVRDVYEDARRNTNTGLRLRLWFDPPELQLLPWELLYDPDRHEFLALSGQTLVTRYCPTVGDRPPLVVEPPLRILIVTAQPISMSPIDAEAEITAIKSVLAPLEAQGQVHIDQLLRAQPMSLRQALAEQKPHVLHFFGHSTLEDDRGMLALEDDRGGPQLLSTSELKVLLQNANVRMTVMNCGYGGRSFGPALAQAALGAVVIMQFSMSEGSARAFVTDFYKSVARLEPVDLAVGRAREALMLSTGEDSRDWATPVLFLSAKDGAIFVSSKERTGQSQAEPTEFYNPDLEPDAVPESLRALVEAGILDEADLDAAMAEMSPEEIDAQRAEEVPDWLRDLMGEEDQAVSPEEVQIEVPAQPAIEETVVEPPAEELPDWLRELGEPAGAEPEVPEADVEEELPDWLRELGEPAVAVTVEAEEEEAPTPEELAVEPLMPEVEERAAAVPESLRALVEAGILDEADLDAAMAEMSPEEVPDWLRELMGEEELAESPDEARAEAAGKPVAGQLEAEDTHVEPTAEDVPNWLHALDEPAERVEVKPPAAVAVPDSGFELPALKGVVEAEPTAVGRKVDLNTATVAELCTLPGIGAVLAARILDYRRKHQGFKDPADIEQIRGISRTTYQAIADRLEAGAEVAVESETGVELDQPKEPAVRRARIDKVEVPRSVHQGEVLTANMQVYNAGETAWLAGEVLLTACRWQLEEIEADGAPLFEQEWSRPLEAKGLEPGQGISLGGLNLTIQDDVASGVYGLMWTVRGRDWDVDDQPGAAEGKIVVLPQNAGVPPRPEGRRVAGVTAGMAQTCFIPYKPQYPPSRDNTVKIEVFPHQVYLTYGRAEPYISLNRLADEAYREQVNLARQQGTPESYGRLLFEAIINDRGSKELHADPTSQGYAVAKNRAGGKLRWQLVLPEYAEYEWECLHDGEAHLAVREEAPLYRRFYKQADRGPVKAIPLKILVAICSPTDLNTPHLLVPEIEALHPLMIDQQRFIIESGLERLKLAGLAEYEILDNEHLDGRTTRGITLGLLREKLQEGYNVLHLLAHGLYAPDREKEVVYQLALESPDGQLGLTPAGCFDQTVLGAKLRLVILAACQSATQGARYMLRGMGEHLIKQGVPAVVAMRGHVPIETVQLFTQRFYDDLARSGRIDMAMAATRGDIYRLDPHSWDWGIPVLMMSTDDGQLFEVDEQLAYEELSRLEPDIKSYQDLPGGDPRPEQMAHMLTNHARAIGVPAHLVSIFQVLAAPALAQPASRKSRPRAPRQDRGGLSARLSKAFEFRADLLRDHVEDKTSGSGLKLPFEVYAQTASALNAGKHVIFIGAPGTGKTSLAHDICTYAETHPSIGQPMSAGNILTTATADWTTFDTVGGYVPTTEGILEFEPGIFLRAVCEGRWLVIDEINRAEIDKAFGELFTLLSGRQVDLPYKVGDEQLRVLPAASKSGEWFERGCRAYDYVMHPNWRILATMNVYDKSYLFQMSFAFMRRFAFVDVDLPGPDTYKELRHQWIDESLIKDAAAGYREKLAKFLDSLFDERNTLMKRRALGPAIAKDVICYLGDRFKHAGSEERAMTAMPGLVAEAFLLYAAPQCDALDQEEISEIYRYLGKLFGYAAVEKGVMDRIEALYPHVRYWEGRPGDDQVAELEEDGARPQEDNE